MNISMSLLLPFRHASGVPQARKENQDMDIVAIENGRTRFQGSSFRMGAIVQIFQTKEIENHPWRRV